jgi:steroid 5-alpha reductase family enzyme
MSEKAKGRLILLCVYLVAFSLGVWLSSIIICNDPTYQNLILMKSAVAVAISVAIIFLGSIIFNNSSVFDPYWSLAPPLMVIYYMVSVLESSFTLGGRGCGVCHFLMSSPRIPFVFLFTLAYSVRLTWNFLRNWPGMKHEDWRYVDFRTNTGKAYWVVSFSGIHFFPALMVFGGTLSLWVTVVQGYRQMNLVDLLAILVTGYAILLEALADKQLRNFLARNTESGKTMSQGLWSLSRHPNYLGEILFWWGLYLFAVAANPSFWWVIIGPLAITLMFVFASIPMIEKRMMKRRKDYAAYRERVSMLIPWKIFDKRVNA